MADKLSREVNDQLYVRLKDGMRLYRVLGNSDNGVYVESVSGLTQELKDGTYEYVQVGVDYAKSDADYSALTVKLNVDVSEALTGLKAIQREAREATKVLRELEAKVSDANELLAIQGEDGNWDYSDYMLGMYNGMELIVSVVEGREPSYRSKKGGGANG